MEIINCVHCMFWVVIEGKTKTDGRRVGECRRYPNPMLVERVEDWWCGEGTSNQVSPSRGRNKG